jgi:KDO2-lipid IV(A) lauroyltransferase
VLRAIRWRLEFIALLLLYRASLLLPQRWVVPWGRGLGRLVFHILPLRRTVVLENLRASFGPQLGETEIRRLARRTYENLGITLVEFCRLQGLGREQILALADLEGAENLDACLESGTGAILTSGHFGNWELLGAVLAARGYPIRYLIKSQSNPYVDHMQNEIRRRAGIGVIRQGAMVRELIRALRRREFVGILGDQDAGRQGIFVEFLGRPAAVARGPATFAQRTGSPLVPTAIVRRPDGGHRVFISRPIAPLPGVDEETAVRELTRAHTARLEEIIRRHPEQYFWVHRRWKTQPRPAERPDGATRPR